MRTTQRSFICKLPANHGDGRAFPRSIDSEEGEKLSTAHKMYDNVDIMQTQRDLLKSCTIEEVDAFFKVLDAYLKLF